MKKHFNIKIIGAVQGVFFRASAKEIADKFNIKGLAKNAPDGSVYIEAEGEEKDLDKFLDWCKKGPPSAEVKNIEVKKAPLKKFPEFSIF